MSTTVDEEFNKNNIAINEAKDDSFQKISRIILQLNKLNTFKK